MNRSVILVLERFVDSGLVNIAGTLAVFFFIIILLLFGL
jgi:hypothetical protein